MQVYKSPRLIPFTNFDQFLQDSLRHVNSDFPYSKRRQRKSYLIRSIIESLPEEGEKEEEDPIIQRSSRFSIMRDLNEFGNTGS